MIQAAERGIYTRFQAENWLIINDRRILLRKTLDEYAVYLDETIAQRPKDYSPSLVRKFNENDAQGFTYSHHPPLPGIGDLDIWV